MSGLLQIFRETIESNPEDIEIHYYYRGFCSLSQKHYINAIKDFTQTIDINAKSLGTFYHRGCCYFYMKNYSLAIDDFSSEIKINPQYITAYKLRANAYTALGEITNAEFDFQKVKELEG